MVMNATAKVTVINRAIFADMSVLPKITNSPRSYSLD
jgi:hypothetical protein